MKKLMLVIITLILTSATFAQKGKPVGSKAPDFNGKDQNGKIVNLKNELKKGKVMLVFYRGYWCPNCSRALKSIQDSLNLLTAAKVKVIAVSPETSEGVNKTVANAKATFPVISDKGLIILKKYDVAFTITKDMDDVHKKYKIDVEGNNGANGNILPRPSAFLINQNGVIAYRYFNTAAYSDASSAQRITVKEILAQVSK